MKVNGIHDVRHEKEVQEKCRENYNSQMIEKESSEREREQGRDFSFVLYIYFGQMSHPPSLNISVCRNPALIFQLRRMATDKGYEYLCL